MRLILKLVLIFMSVQAMGYPEIISWREKPKIVFENKKHAIYKKNDILKFPFAVLTAERDTLELNLNVKENFIVYPNSKFQVLEMEEGTGQVSEIYLLDGKLKAQSLIKSQSKNAVLIKTPFGDFKLNEESEILVRLNMREPSIEVRLLKGTVPVEFFDYEKKNVLKAGEFVIFVGELSEDRVSIKYDFLLNNRKAPKGKMSEVQTFDVDAFLKSERELLELEDLQKKQHQVSNAEQARRKKILDAKYLCHNPYGQKNQCFWKIEKKTCFRRRCNVSGQWGDKTERPTSGKCKKEGVVDACDY